MTGPYDLVFVGNYSIDEIHTFEGPVQTLFGGGVAFSAMAAVWTGKRIAVVTRLAQQDADKLDRLRAAGIDVFVTYTPETTRHTVHHLSADVDKRRVRLITSAGPPSAGELDALEAGGDGSTLLHLAALTDRETSLGFVEEAGRRGFNVSVDLQGFIRQVDPETGDVTYGAVADKEHIVRSVPRIKLDTPEARHLTGLPTAHEAAMEMERWGARETMITWADGVLVRYQGSTYSEPFFNRSVEGRTGRGDTTFGSYLACRLDHSVADSLRWAAAVASIKLEKPGLFAGTREQVRARMDAVRRYGQGGLQADGSRKQGADNE